MKSRNLRSKKGMSMIVLVTFIAFFVVLPLCLVGFEMGRYYLLLTQVENVAGACALSGTGAIATVATGTGSLSGSALQGLYNGCANEAIYCLRLNNILGNDMINNVETVDPNRDPSLGPLSAPSDGKANIALSFINQDGSWHSDLKTSGAVKMKVTISYSTHPIFSTPGIILSLMPIETATASSVGGLPQLDVFLCFDVSGSMDDQTPVALVNRYWDISKNCVAYDFLANSGPGQTPDTIYNQCNSSAKVEAGTTVNAVPPQNLSFTDNRTFFNQQMRCNTLGVGSPPEAGQTPGGTLAGIPPAITYPTSPPGTVTAGTAAVPNQTWFEPYGTSYPSWTDMVVIKNTSGTGASPLTYAGTWKSDAVVELEWARGNLVDKPTLTLSQGGAASLAANTTYGPTLTSLAGTSPYNSPAKYWEFAAENATPSFQALQAAQSFVTTMNLSTDARFGLSTFATDASSPTINTYPQVAGSPTQTLISEQNNTIPPYVYGGVPNGGTYPLPFVSLSAGSPGSFNAAFKALAPPDATLNPYNPLSSTNTQLVPLVSTQIYNALDTAIKDMNSNGRPTAKHAIVLFTDGIPSTSLSAQNNTSDIINLAATTAKTSKIPIYTIGLAQNAALVTDENNLLGPVASSAYTGGQYFATTSAKDLNAAFQSIARSLVLLQGY
ncbi:MAG TPA: vWA domain-containing protein [Drouetiella sp.]